MRAGGFFFFFFFFFGSIITRVCPFVLVSTMTSCPIGKRDYALRN